MVEGLAIFGGVCAAWSLAKDVRRFVKKLKRAGCDIKDLDLRFADDIRRLSHCKSVLLSFENRLPEDDARHLHRIARRIRRIAADLKRNFDRYFRGCRWSRLIWATHGSSISKAEEELAFWVARLRTAITDYGLFDLSNSSSGRTMWSNTSQRENLVLKEDVDRASTSQTLVPYPNHDSPRHRKVKETPFIDLNTMRDEMYAAMTTPSGTPSIPRHTTLSIIANHGLKAIIQQDVSLQVSLLTSSETFDADNFDKTVKRDAQSLLAILIFIEADLILLKELLTFGITDKSLPLKSSVIDSLASFPQAKRAAFMKWQHAFRTSENEAQSTQYTPRVRLLMNDGRETVTAVPRVSSTLLGEGAFGRVYKTSMDYIPSSGTSTWGFSKGPEEQPAYFAVKCFHDPNGIESYRREIEVLRELRRKPHHNIMPSLGTWKDSGGRYNIVFPLANLNLRQMIGLEPPHMDRSFVKNLQAQLHGISSGIQHIHNTMKGWHQDLKPENILVCLEHGEHVWKISDFGIARMKDSGKERKTINSHNIDFDASLMNEGNRKRQAFDSHNTSRGGTTAYLPPERQTGTKAMQRSDMWSYGCTMLEIMEWVFKPPSEHASQPLRKRLGDGMKSGRAQPDAFWCKDPGGISNLRPSVTKTIETIVNHPACTQGMASIMVLIQGLLTIDTTSRLTAGNLTDRLSQIATEEERLLNDDPFFYLRLTAHAYKLANNSVPVPRNPAHQTSLLHRIFRPPWRWKDHGQDSGTSGSYTQHNQRSRGDIRRGFSEPIYDLSVSTQNSHTTRRRRLDLQAQLQDMTL